MAVHVSVTLTRLAARNAVSIDPGPDILLVLHVCPYCEHAIAALYCPRV